MSRWNLAWLLGIPSAIMLGLTITYSAPLPHDRNDEQALVKLLVDVLAEVDQNYVRELDPETRRRLVEDMINGGLERLDPHSMYLGAREYKQFDRKSRGKFGGIGVHISLDRMTGLLQIVSPMVGSPAYEAGIQPGDLVLKVDGHSLENKRTAEAIELIQGDVGQPVTLTVLHEGDSKPVDITIVRAMIEVPTVLGDLRQPDDSKEWDFIHDKENKIAYVRVIEFDEPTAPSFRRVLEDLQGQGVRGLVIDVRGNPGGLLKGAVEVSDMFLTGGRIVSTQGRRYDERPYEAKVADTLFEPAAEHPVAVIIDRFSASASEIFAAALQDHDRAVIVGERSYGKGSVQNVLLLEGNRTALKLTTASYLRPSGKNIHRFPDSKDTDEWGVKPTEGFEVKLTDPERRQWLTARRQRDVVPGKNGNGSAEKKKDPGPFVDKALDKAMDYVRGELKKIPI